MPRRLNKNAKTDKLDTIIGLLKHVLAIQLYRSGVPQDVIGKHLHIAKSSVVEMVKGAKKEK